jgi:hypothetical protein
MAPQSSDQTLELARRSFKASVPLASGDCLEWGGGVGLGTKSGDFGRGSSVGQLCLLSSRGHMVDDRLPGQDYSNMDGVYNDELRPIKERQWQ